MWLWKNTVFLYKKVVWEKKTKKIMNGIDMVIVSVEG